MKGLRRYLLVAALSALVHLPGISSPPLDYHYHRQVNTSAVARNYVEDGLHFFEPHIDWEGHARTRAATEFPLYSYLMALLWNVGDLGHLWGRILSLLFSALTAALLLAFLEGWLDPEPSLYAAALFSLIPVEVYFGRTIQPEAFALLLSVAALLALDRYLLLRRDRGPGARAAAWLALAWACAAVSIGHKLPYLYLLGVCAVMAWARLGSSALRDAGLWAFFPSVSAAVFAWYRHASTGTYVVPTKQGEFLGLLDYPNLPRYVSHQFVSRFPEITVTWPGMALWAAGWAAARGLPGRTRFFLYSWFAVVCAYTVAGSGYTYHHEYTALPFALINAALMGLGLRRLLAAAKGAARPAWAAAGLAAVLAAVPINTFFRIKHWYRISYPYLLTAKAHTDAVSAPDDLFLCNDRSGSAYFYFTHRKGWAHYLEENPTEPMPWIRERMLQGAKFYLTHDYGVFADRDNPFSKPVYDAFPVVFRGDGIILFRLTPSGRHGKA